MPVISLRNSLLKPICSPCGEAHRSRCPRTQLKLTLRTFNFSKVAVCLVTRGVLRSTAAKGGPLISGESVARARVIWDDRGNSVKQVTPGYAAAIAGWKTFPTVGSVVLEMKSEVCCQSISLEKYKALPYLRRYSTGSGSAGINGNNRVQNCRCPSSTVRRSRPSSSLDTTA